MSDQSPPFLPPPPSGPPTGPPPPAQPVIVRKDNRTWLWAGAALIVGLLIGVGIGSSSGSSSDSSASASTPTTTAGKAAKTTTTVRTTTTERATTTTAAPYTPVPADFAIGIVETERSCFGSAGCSITYRIDVNYNGKPMEPGSKYTVVYEVRGGETVEKKNFTIEGDNIEYREDAISTGENPTITAVATQVLEG